MRVLVATDRIGVLSSAQAGRALAEGWPGASRAVLPIGEAGAGFVQALADLAGMTVVTAADGDVVVSTALTPGLAVVGIEASNPVEGLPYDASSRPLGEAVARVLAEFRPRQLYVDLAGAPVHDGGAGLLAALGASADGELDRGVAGLGDVTRLDLGQVRARLADTELIGVVPADQLTQPLLGLRGITSLLGRGEGASPERMLQTDAALERFARLAGPDVVAEPGAGAAGGLGFAIRALGGRLTTGPAVALASVDLTGVDLVVTGTSTFDFAARGGGVVAALAAAAGAALSPCIVVAGEVFIGSREMRTMGIDAAYAAGETGDLAAVARRVARSWSW